MRPMTHYARRCYLYLIVWISYVVRYQLRNSLTPPFLGRPCNPIMKRAEIRRIQATNSGLSCGWEQPEARRLGASSSSATREDFRRSAASLVAMSERPATAVTIGRLVGCWLLCR